jgi:hypothetical protein
MQTPYAGCTSFTAESARCASVWRRTVGFVMTIILALSGGVVAAVIGAWATLHARRPPGSHVELVDVSLAPPSGDDASPILDIKVRNTGGQPAVIKRVVVRVNRAVRCGTMFGSMRLTPFRAVWLGATLEVSARYDISIPVPEKSTGFAEPVAVSQAVAPGEPDRFELRLGMKPAFDAYIYDVTLELVYDGNDRTALSPSIAVLFPHKEFKIYTKELIRQQIDHFLKEVPKVRAAIDAELVAHGRPARDWESAPPKCRADLPDGMLSVDGTGESWESGGRGVYQVTDEFWNPRAAIAAHLVAYEKMYAELAAIIQSVAVADPLLTRAMGRVTAILADLPALFEEFSVTRDMADDVAGHPVHEARDYRQPTQLLAAYSKTGTGLDEITGRIRSGDPGTIWFFTELIQAWRTGSWRRLGYTEGVARTAEALDEFLHLRQPGDPADFELRRELASVRADTDRYSKGERHAPADAAAMLARALADATSGLGATAPQTMAIRRDIVHWQVESGEMRDAARVLRDVVADAERTDGPDSKRALAWRQNLGYCTGESGDTSGAIAIFSDLAADAERSLGPDDECSLAARHELARWRGEAGDPAAARDAFLKVVRDRDRVQGPAHPDTLIARHNLARWRGEAGDAEGAVAAFTDLVEDRRRILGPEHADTQKSEAALTHWKGQLAQRR